MAANPNMQARLDNAATITPGDVAGQPQPLVRDIPEGEPYPVHALGPLRGAVEAVHYRRQAPVAIPAQSALAVAALALQAHADVETLGGYRPLSLYCLTIAGSGERKSSCDDDLMQAMHEYERAQEQNYREARKAWAIDHAIWKKRQEKVLNNVKSGKADRGELEALGPEPSPPPLHNRLASEPTYEGLTRLFAEGQPTLGLFSDEGGQFLGGFAMSQDNRQKTLAALNDLWQGKPIRRTRQGDGAFTLHGRRLSLHLMAQPIVVHALLADPLASDTGFLPRCLICEPQTTIGTRLYRADPADMAALDDFAERLGDILNTGMTMDPETRELRPRPLRLSPAARQALIVFSDEVEQGQAAGQPFEGIRGYASKAAEQAARLAGVLTLWADYAVQEVPAEAMHCGITLARWYLGEALRLSGVALVSEAVGKAEALRAWMLSESWDKPWLTLREVVRLGPNSLREGPKARKAVELLVEYGWLIPMKKRAVIDGQAKREAWRIVR